MPPPKKKRARQTTLPFHLSSSPGLPSNAPTPASANDPPTTSSTTSNKPRNAFAVLMRSPSKEVSHPLSSPTPARPRINVSGFRYSDTDSEDEDEGGWRGRKNNRGLVGLAEAREGKSAGFFGVGGGVREGRGRWWGQGREKNESGSSEVEEVVEVDVGEKKKGKNKEKVVIQGEGNGQDDEDERLKRKIREKKAKKRAGSATVAVDSGKNVSVDMTRNQAKPGGKELLSETESGEGTESTEEKNLKEWIRAKKKERNQGKGADDNNEKDNSKKNRNVKGKEKNGKGKEKGKSRGKKQEVVEVLSNDDNNKEVVTIAVIPPSKRRGKRWRKYEQVEEIQEVQDVDGGENSVPSKTKTRDGTSVAISTKSSKRDQKEMGEKYKNSRKRSRASAEEEEDEDEDVVQPAGKRGKFRHLLLKGQDEDTADKEKGANDEASPDSGFRVTEAMREKVNSWMIQSDNNEDEEAALDDPDLGTQERARITKKRGRGRRGKRVVIEEDESEEDAEGGSGENLVDVEAEESDREDSEAEAAPQRQTRSARGRRNHSILDMIGDDDDDLPIITPSSRHRLKSAGNSSPALMAKADSDMGSDVELAAQTPVLKSRTRYKDTPKKLTPYQKKLKELQARRQGIDPVSEEEEEEASRRKALYDSETPDEEGHMSDEVGEVDDHGSAALGTPGRRNGGLDSDIDSFIVTDDEEGPLGAPADADDDIGGPIARIPIQFTSQSHASLKNHFKTVVQYMLNLLLNPSFPKNDEYFTFALHSIDRKVDSFRDSVLKSEAWKGDFFRALKSRPGFEFDPNGGHGWEDHCMACNRRDRNASYTVRFTGKLYDPETFSDYESEDEDVEQEDGMGNIIPPSGHPFPVGSYCYERAEITHSFWHWKKGLRMALEEVLTQMGVFEKEVLRKLKKMKDKERWRWVDGKLGELERGGDVDLLWGMFQAQMRRAEEFMSKPARFHNKR